MAARRISSGYGAARDRNGIALRVIGGEIH